MTEQNAEKHQALTDAEWYEFQRIPEHGYSHRAWVDARIAERVAVATDEARLDVRRMIEQYRGSGDHWRMTFARLITPSSLPPVQEDGDA